MRPQTVSLYTQGKSVPDINCLKKIANFFSVTADYLLGLTKVQNPDVSLQAAAAYTGLSEGTLTWLHDVAGNQERKFAFLALEGQLLKID